MKLFHRNSSSSSLTHPPRFVPRSSSSKSFQSTKTVGTIETVDSTLNDSFATSSSSLVTAPIIADKRRVQFCAQSQDIHYDAQLELDQDLCAQIWYTQQDIDQFRYDVYTFARFVIRREQHYVERNVEETTGTSLSWSQLLQSSYQDIAEAKNVEKVRQVMSTAQNLSFTEKRPFMTPEGGIDPLLIGLEKLALPGLKQARSRRRKQMYSFVALWQSYKELSDDERSYRMRKSCRQVSRAGRIFAIYLAALVVTEPDAADAQTTTNETEGGGL